MQQIGTPESKAARCKSMVSVSTRIGVEAAKSQELVKMR